MQKYNLTSLSDFEQFTIEKMNSLSQELKLKEIKILDIERKLKLFQDSKNKIEEIEEETEKLQKKKSEKESQKKKLESDYNNVNKYLSEFKLTNVNKLNEIKLIQLLNFLKKEMFVK